MNLRCTIFENEIFWLRWASTHGSVDKFNHIRCFIKKSFGKHHRQLTFRFWFFEIYLGVNPFKKLSTISIGARYFTYHFVQFKYEKSLLKSLPNKEA